MSSPTPVASNQSSKSEKRSTLATWRRLMFRFTQDTTFHGVRYITADTPYVTRRVVWIFVVTAAFGFFIWFMTDRFIFLLGNPRTVDVEVIYTDQVNFPAVTICNQNLFRTSAAHNLGLHDIVEDSFRTLQNGEELEEGFQLERNYYLEGMGIPHAVYYDITATVCKTVCEKLHGDSCCSVVYERGKRACYITPLETTSKGVKLVERIYTDYYRRRKCEVQTAANCSFEEVITDGEEETEIGFCAFSHDFTKPLKWKQIDKTKEKKLGYAHPLQDHTTLTGAGKYIIVATKFHQPNTMAHLVSPYILSEDNTCIEFYYQIRGGILSVATREQGSVYKTIWSQMAPSKGEWQLCHIKLPHGYFRIVIEAKTGSGTDIGNIVNIAIDDLNIGYCEEDLQCKQSPSGSGYSGKLAVTNRQEKCEAWSSTPEYLRAQLWWSQDAAIVQENIPDMSNYCRNPDNDPNGPWCFTHADTGRMEYCDIPPCGELLGCRPVEFSCGNGRCISRDLMCDSNDDCGDNSDEIYTCNRTESISCSFDNGWMCGYVEAATSMLEWKMDTWEGMHSVLTVDTHEGRDGDISRLVSPLHSNPFTTCLHIDYYITGKTVIDISYQNSSANVILGVQRLCSLSSLDSEMPDWQSSDILLPPGSYHLILDVLSNRLADRIYLDNMTLLNENCTAFVEIAPIMTTEEPTTVMTTESTENVTESASWTSTEEGISTAGGTTAMYTTMEPYIVDLHEAFEHTMCWANNSSCSTCAQSFAEREECSKQFAIVASDFEGYRCNCEHIRPRERPKSYTVETCKNETIKLGGNAFNFRDDYCQVKRCSDLRDPDAVLSKISRGVRGWDVYLLQVGELDGIPCSFTDKCACGYRYISSNRNDVWLREEREMPVPMAYNSNFTANFTVIQSPRKEYYLRLSNPRANPKTKRGVPKTGEWSRLITPTQLVSTESCLRFSYYTSYIDIRIFMYWENKTKEVMALIHDGQKKAWHKAAANLPVGEYGLVFQAGYGVKWTEHNAGLANINISAGPCFQEHWGPFDCSFDEDDYCNYQDRSEGTIKWIRSRNYRPRAIPGGYYLRTSGVLPGKGSTIMASPMYTYSNRSCVSFYYFLQGKLKARVSTLSISMEDEDRHTEVVWRLHSITDNEWHYAQAQLEPGTYRLLFELSGDQIRTGVDDITVMDGECPDYNCSDHEFACTGNFACISQSRQCDGIPNCHEGEEELPILCLGAENETLSEISEEDGGMNGAILEGTQVNPTPSNIDLGAKLNLTEIYMRAGHQGQDLLYGCKWEGETCSYENFTKQVTDYGLCYTFNSEEQGNLSTAKTGSRFGLSVTMNIEQYEYMRGPQSDAGIKVFLHSKNELPEVRDLGFAIAPGLHALVAIRLNEAENLPRPIGDCGVHTLEYYTGDDYVYSKCIRECETTQINEMCGCRDAYMPGFARSIDNPPVCNLTMYFSCAIPSINSVKLSSSRSRCECPKPCKQTIYEPGLSQAALSVLSVDNILTENKDLLLKKYHDALESRQRVESSIFSTDMLMITEIIKQYKNMRRFAKTYLGDVEKSSFAKVWTATGTLLKIFRDDMGDLMGDLPKHKEAYMKFYDDGIILVRMYMQELDKSLQELRQMITMKDNNMAKLRPFFNAITSSLVMKVLLAHENFELFHLKITNQSSLTIKSNEDKDLLAFLPVTFAVSNHECLQRMKELSATLKQIAAVLQEAPDWQNPNPRSNDEHTTKENLEEYTNAYFLDPKYITTCLDEYRNVLDKTMEWVEGADKKADDYAFETSPFAGDQFNFTTESGIIEKDERAMESLRTRYAHAQMTKLGYLSNFDPAESSSEVLTRINTFVDRIQSRLTSPLRQRITKMRHELLDYYHTAFQKASHLQKYLKPNTFYDKSKTMKIWRIPSPNFENPERYHDTAREYWRVWNRDMPLRVFVRSEASKYIAEGVNAFCDPLLKILDDFEEQLLLNTKKLTTAIEKMGDEHTKYTELRKIDHTFILNNFMAVDVYFSQLKHQNVKQLQAYQITQFLGDVGGFMGLLLGGSLLTLFELCDLIIFHVIKTLFSPEPEPDEESRDDASGRHNEEVYSNRLAPIATPDKEYWIKTKDGSPRDLSDLPPPPPPGFGTDFSNTFS